jgi:glycosyltransferase involved in cell wall biosynthesis
MRPGFDWFTLGGCNGLAMKILQLLATVNPTHGGPVEITLQSGVVCRDLGHQVEIASLDHPKDLWVGSCPIVVHALGRGEKAHATPGSGGFWMRYGYSPRLVPWLRANHRRFDVILVHGLWNYAALAAKRALFGSDTRYLVFTHGMLDPWFRRAYPLKHLAKQMLWFFSEGPLLNGAARVIFTTDEECRLANKAFWPYQLAEQVLSLGTTDPPPACTQQTEAFFQAFPRLRGRRFLLFLSRIHPKKGIDLLIRAFASRTARTTPELDLVIAGPDLLGLRAQYKKAVRELGLDDRVIWTGMVQGDIKWGMIRAAEALILPSHQENFGIVVIEAMACGRPVLISNKVNLCDQVEASGSGIIATDDLAGTETLIDRFLALSDESRAKMGASARRCFLNNFEIHRSVESLIDLVSKLR